MKVETFPIRKLIMLIVGLLLLLLAWRIHAAPKPPGEQTGVLNFRKP
jgi:hypothetical protein